jgi:CheY-like chemotaxis protein
MGDLQEAPDILLVEDEPLIRMCSADLLEDAGYSVIEAENADEAIKILGANPEVKVLFTDVKMPGNLDGLQLARLVHERWPGVKLLVASGHHQLTDGDIPDDGRFLQKPYRPAAVLRDIGEMLSETPDRGEFTPS